MTKINGEGRHTWITEDSALSLTVLIYRTCMTFTCAFCWHIKAYLLSTPQYMGINAM
jgi:hypothetical protein